MGENGFALIGKEVTLPAVRNSRRSIAKNLVGEVSLGYEIYKKV